MEIRTPATLVRGHAIAAVRLGAIAALACAAACAQFAEIRMARRESFRYPGQLDVARRPAPDQDTPLMPGPPLAVQAIPPIRPSSVAPGQAAPATTPILTRVEAYQALAELLYRVVDATEQHDPALRKLDAELEQIDREMSDIRGSVGWEVEIASRKGEIDGTRRDSRGGWTQRLDGTFRRPYNLTGDLDERESRFIIRLKRSFLGPDHEKWVKIALKRLTQMDAVIDKQKVRRDLHLATLETVVDLLHRQAALPLAAQQIALAEEKCAQLRTLNEAGEALREDLLKAEAQRHAFEAQYGIHQSWIRKHLGDLRRKTGNATLSPPTTFPLAVRPLPPPEQVDDQAATSYALEGRVEYQVARWRLRLADNMATYMAWYWPEIQFEVWWNRFHGHRKWLDEYRSDRGKEFSTELTLVIPLNLPRRGWARHQQFCAARDAYAAELEEQHHAIADAVGLAYLAWQEAALRHETATRQIEQLREAARVIALRAARLPEALKGSARVAQIDAQLEILKAQTDLQQAEHDLLLAQAKWDYLVGDSAIDQAVEPFTRDESRAVEKMNWLKWWIGLTW